MTATARRLQGADKAPFFGAIDERMLPEPARSSARVRSKAASSLGKAESGITRLSLRATEKALELRIRVELSTMSGCRFWKHRATKSGTTQGRAGLGVGIADLVGIVTTVSGVGRFVGLEVKTSTGRPSANQKRWLAAVLRFGGFAAIVRSPEEARAAVEKARRA